MAICSQMGACMGGDGKSYVESYKLWGEYPRGLLSLPYRYRTIGLSEMNTCH